MAERLAEGGDRGGFYLPPLTKRLDLSSPKVGIEGDFHNVHEIPP